MHKHNGTGDRSRQLQGLIGEANERLYRLAADGPAATFSLLCECGRCTDRVAVTTANYNRTQDGSRRLLVKRGHEHADPVRWQTEAVSLIEPDART